MSETLKRGAATAKTTASILKSPIAPGTLTTAAPVEASTVVSLVEFCTVRDARRLFGLPRSTLYSLEKRKLISLVRGPTTGTRHGQNVGGLRCVEKISRGLCRRGRSRCRRRRGSANCERNPRRERPCLILMPSKHGCRNISSEHSSAHKWMRQNDRAPTNTRNPAGKGGESQDYWCQTKGKHARARGISRDWRDGNRTGLVMRCRRESLKVTAALLEALGVPEAVGLPAEVCVSRLLDVEAFLRASGHPASTRTTSDPTGRFPRRRSN